MTTEEMLEELKAIKLRTPLGADYVHRLANVVEELVKKGAKS